MTQVYITGSGWLGHLSVSNMDCVVKLYTVSSTGIHALGDGSSDCSVTNDFSPSLKKESNGKFTYVLKRSVDFCKF